MKYKAFVMDNGGTSIEFHELIDRLIMGTVTLTSFLSLDKKTTDVKFIFPLRADGIIVFYDEKEGAVTL